MPRDGSGNYTLPLGNPVIDGTIIDVNWANPTMSDIAVQLNNVLTRDGLLGPIDPFYVVDGTPALPGLGFIGQNNSGLYRTAPNTVGLSVQGVSAQTWTPTGSQIANNVLIGGNLTVNGSIIGGTNTVFGSPLIIDDPLNPQLQFKIASVLKASVATDTTGLAFAGDTVRMYAGGLERMRIDPTGRVLIGTTTAFAPSYPLNIQGGVEGQIALHHPSGPAGQFWHIGDASGTAFVVYNAASAGVYMPYGGTAWVANSDENNKTDFVEFTSPVAKVMTLRSGTGRYLADEPGTERSFLIAQDVQAVLPSAVSVAPGDSGLLGLAYTDVIPLLVAAIKELNARLVLIGG